MEIMRYLYAVMFTVLGIGIILNQAIVEPTFNPVWGSVAGLFISIRVALGILWDILE